MSGYKGIGEGIKGAIYFMVFMLVIFVPFGLWKIVNLIIEFLSHVYWK